MIRFAALVVAVSWSSSVTGLMCWTCNNARSEENCVANGEIQRCRRFPEMACQTEIRFHEGWGGGPLISSGCKEFIACNNNEGQISQCGTNTMNSVCRCCCRRFNCNKRNLLCSRDDFRQSISISINRRKDEEKTRSSPIPTEKSWRKGTTQIDPFETIEDIKPVEPRVLQCETLGMLNHGEISCSGTKNGVGTVCQFRCIDHGFQLNHNYLAECVESNGEAVWTNKKPRCIPRKQCPPIARKDIVIMLDSSMNRARWKAVKDFASDVVGRFDVSPNTVQFSVFRFNGRVDIRTKIMFEDYQNDPKGLQMALKYLPRSGYVSRLGKALNFANKRVLTRGNRNDAEDIILVITNRKTRDAAQLKKVSRELNENGVKILALGISSAADDGFSDELIAITGRRDRILMVNAAERKIFSDNLLHRVTEMICK